MIRRAFIRALSSTARHSTAGVLTSKGIVPVAVFKIRGGFAKWWVDAWGVTGFSIDGAIFTLRPNDRAHLAHELEHSRQAVDVPWFAVRYVAEFVSRWTRQPLHPKEAYRSVSFEVEARAAKAKWIVENQGP